MPSGEWTVSATCPHGRKVDLGFDALGYLTRPADNACDQHEQQPPVISDTVQVRPGWIKLWRETRRLRRGMRDL